MTEKEYNKMFEELFGIRYDGDFVTFLSPREKANNYCKCVDTPKITVEQHTRVKPVINTNKYEIQSILANKNKGVFTVVWKDNTHTSIHLQDGDTWDDEKALAMCFVKKMKGNKGNFNDIFTIEMPAKLKTIEKKEKPLKAIATEANKAAEAMTKAAKGASDLATKIAEATGGIKHGKYVINLIKTDGTIAYECLLTDDAKAVHKYVSDWADNANCPYCRSWEQNGALWIDYGSYTHYLEIKGMTMNKWLGTK